MDERKILVIDDEKEFLASIKVLLELQGYSVVTASDGAEGLNKAKVEFPDLVICDMKMPKKDGYEVLKELKQNTKQWVPFIMLTAIGEFDKIKQAYDCECDFYLTKPVEPAILLRNVRTLLSLGNALADRKV